MGGTIVLRKALFQALKIKALEAAASQVKGRVLCNCNGPTPEIDSMTVMIDWLSTGDSYNQGPVVIIKMVLQNQSFANEMS